VEQRYEDVETFHATFTQTYTVKGLNMKKITTGDVIFERPDKMRWVYDPPPNGGIVVAVAAALKIYDPVNKRADVMSTAMTQYPVALSFLTERGITRDFTLRLLDSAQINLAGAYLLECTPKRPTPTYWKLVLYVDEQTYQVHSVLVLDVQGNKNRFDFGPSNVNQPVPAGAFNLVLPVGTSVINGTSVVSP
jgi:outer membrane lipoprotein carrier protein